MTLTEILHKFLGSCLNEKALIKGGEVEQTLGEVLTIEEMLDVTKKCASYFCEIYGIPTDQVIITYLGDTPNDFNIILTVNEGEYQE